MPGLLVSFEGGEGSGKTTQLGRLATRLRARGIEPVLTREPGGTPLAESLRELLLREGPPPLSPTVEALIVEAARADLVANRIRPALALGQLVLCDRFIDSTLAYQGWGRGLDRLLLTSWNQAATGGLEPDLTLLFDVDPALGLLRRGRARSNRIDREPPEFHRKVREGFLELARQNPDRIVVLDAARDPDRVEELAWSALEPRLAAVSATLPPGR